MTVDVITSFLSRWGGLVTGRPWPGLGALLTRLKASGGLIRRDVKALLGRFRVEWTPRLLDVCGFTLIIAAVGLAFGLAPGLAATGVALLLIGWALSDGGGP